MVIASGGAAGIGVLILIALYFLPTIVAASRKVVNLGSIVVINVFLGWTLVGWVVALAMAVRTKP
jgi:Superinfection immunity protein